MYPARLIDIPIESEKAANLAALTLGGLEAVSLERMILAGPFVPLSFFFLCRPRIHRQHDDNDCSEYQCRQTTQKYIGGHFSVLSLARSQGQHDSNGESSDESGGKRQDQ